MADRKWVVTGVAVMGEADRREAGELTRSLRELAEQVMDGDDLIDPDSLRIEQNSRRHDMPDCANCESRCCIHKGADEGILLSLQDIAALADNGFEDLIVGTYTFKKKKGKILPEIDQMPRLAKRQGNCIFYAPETGMCTGYGFRPTICRRFPFEVEYRKKTEEPFARYIPDAPCPKVNGPEYAPAIAEMVREAVVDENISLEDAEILPDFHEELREMGFGRWLPPEWDCPEPAADDDEEDDD